MIKYKKGHKIQLDHNDQWLHVYKVGFIDNRHYLIVESINGVLWDLSRITDHKDYF